MGQQQLLLLVLSIVIVGLAVVAGIQAFDTNQRKANADAMVNDAVSIASNAQAWKLKPGAFGGGGNNGNGDFTGLTLPQLGYDVTGANNTSCADGEYETVNGCFTMTASGSNVVITGKSIPDSNNDNQVKVTVEGTNSADVATAVTNVDDAS